MSSIVTLPVSPAVAILAEELFVSTPFTGKASYKTDSKGKHAKFRMSEEGSQFFERKLRSLEAEAAERAEELHAAAAERWKAIGNRDRIDAKRASKPEKIKKEKVEKASKVSAREQRAVALQGATPVRMVPVPSIPVPMVNDARMKVRAEIAARRAAAGL